MRYLPAAATVSSPLQSCGQMLVRIISDLNGAYGLAQAATTLSDKLSDRRREAP
jgi:hypothetical protein